MKSTNFPLIHAFVLLMGMLSCFSSHIFAQAPEIEWQKLIGGTSTDEGHALDQTTDGGFILAGWTTSNVPGFHGGPWPDALLVKTDNLGDTLWQRAYGGSSDERFFSVVQTSDGGYIACGQTNSPNNGDVSGWSGGSYDGWVVKVDSGGNIEWQKPIGGLGYDLLNSVVQSSDGNYVVAGSCGTTISGNLNPFYGGLDCLVAKLPSLGGVPLWLRTYGGSGTENGLHIIQTIDGGFIVSGQTNSENLGVSGNLPNGFVFGNHSPSVLGPNQQDGWLVKVASNGVFQWQKCLGGASTEILRDVWQNPDGSYVVFGWTVTYDSNTTDNVVGNHGGFDFWITQVGSTGIPQWTLCVGGTGSDVLACGARDLDGGFILAGSSTGAPSGDVPGNYGGLDCFMSKVSSSGTSPLWSKNYGGNQFDAIHDLEPTPDGGYIFVGRTQSSNSVDVNSPNNGGVDVWLVKLKPTWSTLPVRLLSFDGEKLGEDKVMLRWLTASEQNCDSFQVRRSTDMVTWSVVGSLPGSGTTFTEYSYELVDGDPILGAVNYYELQEKDVGGSWQSLEVVTVLMASLWDESKPYCVIGTSGHIVMKDLIGAYTLHLSTGIYVLQQEGGATMRVFVP